MEVGTKSQTISKLRSEISRFERLKPSTSGLINNLLGPICDSFPQRSFPIACIHEFICDAPEVVASSSGFISAILSGIMQKNGAAVWISTSSSVFPPALCAFGLQPEQVLFIRLKKEREVVDIMDEVLKCSSFISVIAETPELSFTASRRLQLSVEESNVTGFIMRKSVKVNTTTCVARWKISPLPSLAYDDLPGIGLPRWQVELLRIRNGRSGKWDIQWREGRFEKVEEEIYRQEQRQTG